MTDKELSEDMKLLSDIIAQICNYAVDNGMKPTETVKTVAENLLALCQISDFDNWHKFDLQFRLKCKLYELTNEQEG